MAGTPRQQPCALLSSGGHLSRCLNEGCPSRGVGGGRRQCDECEERACEHTLQRALQWRVLTYSLRSHESGAPSRATFSGSVSVPEGTEAGCLSIRQRRVLGSPALAPKHPEMKLFSLLEKCFLVEMYTIKIELFIKLGKKSQNEKMKSRCVSSLSVKLARLSSTQGHVFHFDRCLPRPGQVLCVRQHACALVVHAQNI